MSAAELLEQAQAEGVLLVLADGRLTWEADHEPPSELLEEIRAHRLEIIETLRGACDPSPRAWDWLACVARLLACSPEYLLERRFLLPEELSGLCRSHPSIAARAIRTHPDWLRPSDCFGRRREGMAPSETAVLRDQYARVREGSAAGTHSSTIWLAARDAYHRHALGGCPVCYPRGGRHCKIGAELRVCYDHEASVLEGQSRCV